MKCAHNLAVFDGDGLSCTECGEAFVPVSRLDECSKALDKSKRQQVAWHLERDAAVHQLRELQGCPAGLADAVKLMSEQRDDALRRLDACQDKLDRTHGDLMNTQLDAHEKGCRLDRWKKAAAADGFPCDDPACAMEVCQLARGNYDFVAPIDEPAPSAPSEGEKP